MGVIVPAVLPQSREDLEEKLALFSKHTDADTVQIDIVDGRFASPPSWPYANGSEAFAVASARGDTLPYLGRFRYEVDLMTSDPEQVTGLWIAAGVSRVTVHAESTTYLPKIITDLTHTYGYERDFVPDLLSFGLAIGIATDLALVEQYLENLNYVQFMGIAAIGKQGQPFDTRVVRKIALFRKRHPGIEIQVDGGVTKQTAPALLSAGVDRLIVGHALLQAKDMRKEYEELSALALQYGTYE